MCAALPPVPPADSAGLSSIPDPPVDEDFLHSHHLVNIGELNAFHRPNFVYTIFFSHLNLLLNTKETVLGLLIIVADHLYSI
jgi:hypothetical protein